MQRKSALAACLLFVLSSALMAWHDAPKEYKEQNEIMEKLFKAYNKKDAKGIFENYIEAFQKLGDQLYDSLYKEHREKLGEYKKHQFVKDGSVISDGQICLMILDAEFEKNKKVKVSVNFMKEGKAWKIQQVVIEPK